MAGELIPFGPRTPGLVRTVSNAEMDAAEAKQIAKERAAKDSSLTGEQYIGLPGMIRTEWDMMVRHRNTVDGWSDRLLAALRTFNGQYDPAKLAEIKKFGGSEVYARLAAAKCRGATSLLRDVYLGAERAWGLEEPADPDVPDEVIQAIETLVENEIQSLSQGAPPVPNVAGGPAAPPIPPSPPSAAQIRDRTFSLMQAARTAAKKRANDQTHVAEDKLDELLTEGGFYKALAEFLVDLPLFPFACIKGPTVRMVQSVTWEGNKAVQSQKPKLWWERVSPFDLWWTPGVADIEDAAMIHRQRYTRADLNDLLDLPGYHKENIFAVLQYYGTAGLMENWDSTDATRAGLESRENPTMNRSGLITCLEYHGNVQGRALLEYGFKPEEITEPMRDYAIQAWLIGQYLIKVQLATSPRRRTPFYLTSFEKVPGTPVGNAIPDIISDLQEVANASLRAVVNNMSISSGPQVVINEDRMAGLDNSDDLFPWKRWRVTNPQVSGSTEKPVDFFQPQSNAQELLGVFNAFYGLADDVSAIPKYLSGNSPGGGAGRTASGLAMLMGNASKILQTVAANIDRDVMAPALTALFDMVILTDKSGLLTGEEQIVPKGVVVAMQRETMRARQLEFLQLTANPIDMAIIGPKGRANLLRSVSHTIGLEGEAIVPSEEALDAQQKQAQMLAQNSGIPGHAMAPPEGGGPPQQGAPGNQVPSPSQAVGPQTNVVTSRVAGGPQ